MTIKGFATPEGTQRYRSRFEGKPGVAQGHFRTAYGDLALSSLGMGTYLGNPDPKTDADMVQAVKTSVTSGVINVIDTAINYRYMASERAIGEALRQLLAEGTAQRDELFLCSKNGYLTPDFAVQEDFPTYFRKNLLEPGVVQPSDIVQNMHCMAPGYLNDQLNRSLANLGVETLDLMYLHNAAESQLEAMGQAVFMQRLEAAFTFYEQARKENRIRYYGMATWDCFRIPPQAKGYLSLEAVVRLAEKVGGPQHGFRFIQFPYNMALLEGLSNETQGADGEMMCLLEACEALGIGVFTSVPLMQGQLLSQVKVNFEGLDLPSQQCLQFVRSSPGVLAPLVGHKNPTHVVENLKVGSVPPLTWEEFERFFVNPSKDRESVPS